MTQDKFDKIWIDGFIILDTCTLDYISRCEYQYAKLLMDILLFCKDRILIPQHVFKEMQPYFDMKKIQKDVAAILFELEEELNGIYANREMKCDKKKNKIISRVSKKIKHLEKYAFQVYANMLDSLKKDYTKQNEVFFPSLSECLALANEEVDALSRSETVNSFLQMIMEKKLPDFSEQESAELLKDIQERISKQLPPGVGDKGKTNNCDGDIIIWNEVKKCIQDRGRHQYLFITNDEKKNNNWFGRESKGIHPLLGEEIHKYFRYDALDITTLGGFVSFCKPYVNEDIDELCDYLINRKSIITTELEDYFNDEGNELLIESISDYVRHNYMGDWALLYDLDMEIDFLEYSSDILNEEIEVVFEFSASGNAEACYHCESEDNLFDTEYEAYGSIKAHIPVQSGMYTEMFSLKYKDIEFSILEMDIETTDPLNGEMDEEDIEEWDSYDDEEYYDDWCID